MILQEQAGHQAGIRAVLLDAFPTPAEADLVDALRVNGHLALSLVEERAQQVIGHVAFSPVATEPPTRDGWGLAPVAVLPDFQRRGVANALIEAGLEHGRETGIPFVVVLGEPSYYGRFGFQPASGFGLASEYDAGDAFMALELQPAGLETVGGLVRYLPEFSSL